MPMRTGAEYLRSLSDGRRVFVDGERVKDVAAHPAFRGAARSIANLYDIAAAPELRERRSEEHTSELQSRVDLVCRLLLEKKKNKKEMLIRYRHCASENQGTHKVISENRDRTTA